MLAPGDHLPHARVWIDTRERMSIRELASDGPILLLFYLFDWSST